MRALRSFFAGLWLVLVALPSAQAAVTTYGLLTGIGPPAGAVFDSSGTQLSFGSWPDGTLAQRSGTSIVGVAYSPVQTYATYATLVSGAPPASNGGAIAFVTNLNNCPVYSDGTNWKPLGGRCVIGYRFQPTTDVLTGVTNVETEYTSAKFTVPVGPLSIPTGGIFIEAWFKSSITSTNTFRIRVNTVSLMNPSVASNQTWAPTASVFNINGSTSTQFATSACSGTTGLGSCTSNPPAVGITGASATFDIQFYGQTTSGSDTQNLEGYRIWWVAP